MIKIKSVKCKNPTDYEFLKKIEIKKENHPDNRTHYIIYYLNRPIGYAEIIWSIQKQLNSNKININNVSIKNEFRRKGLASYLYDFIEKDTNFDIIPSKKEDLNNNSEPFWQSRLKKQNPTDKSLLSKIQIQKELIKIPKDKFRPRNTYYIEYQILLNGKIIGKAQIKKNKNYISWIEIDKNFQRKGLSTYLYDYIEKDLEIKLRPIINQLDDGKAFWKSRK